MANQWKTPLIATLLFLSFSLHSHSILSSSDRLGPSPSPISQPTHDSPPVSISHPPTNTPESLAPVTDNSSPPSPPPSVSPSSSASLVKHSDSPSQRPSQPEEPYQSPSPTPSTAADVEDEHEQKVESSNNDGMSGGQKAGIAVGVLIGACAVGFAGFVYKKRQDNVRRSQYGYDARSSMI